SNDYDDFYNAGYKILITLNTSSVQDEGGEQTAQPFPTDLNLFETQLRSMLNSLQNKKPYGFFVGREPTNLVYNSGPMSDYVNMLEVAIRVLHEYGYPVGDGGLHPQGLTWFTYKDFVARGMMEEAEAVKELFKSNAIQYLNNPNSQPAFAAYLNRVKELLDAYKTLNLDWVNVHIHDPASYGSGGTVANEIAAFINYYRDYTGKPVVSNAFSVSVDDADLLEGMLNQVKDSQMKLAIYFSGNTDVDKALTEDDGTLNDLGIVFRDFIYP
ncbi:MAG TPA: hypothetical protein PL045_05970, partial [Chitinophagaceae bacterium]|nr:hypothetical protein [Chitinophagaceae bacterium]